MRRYTALAVVLAAGALLAGPAAAAVATRAVPTVAMSIVHVVRGCHVWARGPKHLSAAETISVKRGTRLTLRISCPMDFDVKQVAGPKLAIGATRFYSGTTRAIVFRRAGVYKLVARNVQSSEEMGLQTLGDDSVLRLTVRVS